MLSPRVSFPPVLEADDIVIYSLRSFEGVLVDLYRGLARASEPPPRPRVFDPRPCLWVGANRRIHERKRMSGQFARVKISPERFYHTVGSGDLSYRL